MFCFETVFLKQGGLDKLYTTNIGVAHTTTLYHIDSRNPTFGPAAIRIMLSHKSMQDNTIRK
jgi:hypothetical protein